MTAIRATNAVRWGYPVYVFTTSFPSSTIISTLSFSNPFWPPFMSHSFSPTVPPNFLHLSICCCRLSLHILTNAGQYVSCLYWNLRPSSDHSDITMSGVNTPSLTTFSKTVVSVHATSGTKWRGESCLRIELHFFPGDGINKRFDQFEEHV